MISDTALIWKTLLKGKTMSGPQCIRNLLEVARAEGFEDIAAAFEEVGEVEEAHEKRYKALLARIQDGTTFRREEPISGTAQLRICP